MTQQELKQRIEQNLVALRGLRDQVRLDLHLAGMDAKDAWKQLERQIEDAEKLAEDVTETSRHAVQEIVARVNAFRDGFDHRDAPK